MAATPRAGSPVPAGPPSLSVMSQDNDVGAVVELAHRVRAAGLAAVWMQQESGPDALTALAVVGSRVPEVGLGTAVVPVSPRHPIMLANQVRTVVDVVGPRLTLGLGFSHRRFVEDRWGQSYATPRSSLSGYLDRLLPEMTDDAGDLPCDVVLSALGPLMLDLAGGRTDGTILWMTGPRTIREQVVPGVTAPRAGSAAPPRVIAIVPVVVADDREAGRRIAARALAGYGRLPAYRRVLRSEGVLPEDLALIGDGADLAAGLASYLDAGATELVALPVGSPDARAAAIDAVAEAQALLIAASP